MGVIGVPVNVPRLSFLLNRKGLEICIWPGSGNGFLAKTPKAQATKEKIDESDFIKLQDFWASNDTNKKVDNLHNGGRFLQITYLIWD